VAARRKDIAPLVNDLLIDRKLILRKEISTQRIRDWMTTHPEEAAKVRATNRSYVFFRVTGLSNEGEPVGAQGVPLTPGRSIAVDPAHEYGTPFFIEANLPIESGKSVLPFRRLMIAQDTGSAIVGPARADLYWGAGDDAGRIASRIRHPGRFVMLVPRELDIVVAGSEIPLPVPKPKAAAPEATKKDGKGKIVSRQCRGCGRHQDVVAPAENKDRRVRGQETVTAKAWQIPPTPAGSRPGSLAFPNKGLKIGPAAIPATPAGSRLASRKPSSMPTPKIASPEGHADSKLWKHL
jgi:membrane-bound lytic murein transglycosylase A